MKRWVTDMETSRMRNPEPGRDRPLPDHSISLPEPAWMALIVASVVAVLIVSVYCLMNGITIIFMHLFYFPIILLAYHYRYRGFLLSLLLALAYVWLVYLFDDGNTDVITGAWLRFLVFAGIAAVVAFLSEHLSEDRKALLESEKKYRTLFENMLEGFAYCRMIYDKNGKPADWVYLDVNAAFGQLTGLNDVKGKRVLAAIPDIRKLTPELFDIYGQVASTGIPKRFEIDFLPIKKLFRISAFSPQQGYFVAVFEDITEERRVQEEIRKSHDFYLKVLDDFPNPIWRADVNAKCDYFNRNWLDFTGRTLDQELGDGWAKGVHPEDFDRCLKIYLDNFHAKTPFAMEYRLHHHDGTYHWLYDNGTPFFTADGKFAGYIGSCYDIQERRQAEQALHEVNRKLNLLSSITRHDIKNQLFSLKAFLELSKESLGNTAETSEYLLKAERAALAIERQIVFTKEYQDLGVNSPVWQNTGEAVEISRSSLPLRDIEFTADVGDLEVFADSLLEKVFYNLIDNSLRYGGPKMTRIDITARVSGPALVITVEDNGAGIPMENKSRLFTKGFGHNTGLGLFLSREILAITGITIAETGEPGQGARFIITVPEGTWRNRDGKSTE
jgi:PAS domain S-box-containing protein